MRFPSKANALKFLRDAGVEIATVLDVGAKVTSLDLRRVFHDKHHLLFEPVTEAHPKMMEAYRGTWHEVFKLALSDTDGVADLRIERRGSSEVTHATLAPAAPDGEYRKVGTARLDSFLAQRKDKAPYLLKIDVDGNDMAILTGATDALKKTAILILEIQMDNLLERAAFAAGHGFELVDIVDLAYYNDLLHQADLIFIRADVRAELPALQRLNNDTLDWSLWQEA
jgi:FkbM family methyltransferase